jgi:HEAT repeat protein
MCLNIGVERLIKKLGNKNNIEVKEQAIQYLVKIGGLAIDQLTEALEYKNILIRSGVAEVLGKIGSDRALASLKNALKKEENRQVRDQIERSLASFYKMRTY